MERQGGTFHWKKKENAGIVDGRRKWENDERSVCLRQPLNWNLPSWKMLNQMTQCDNEPPSQPWDETCPIGFGCALTWYAELHIWRHVPSTAAVITGLGDTWKAPEKKLSVATAAGQDKQLLVQQIADQVTSISRIGQHVFITWRSDLSPPFGCLLLSAETLISSLLASSLFPDSVLSVRDNFLLKQQLGIRERPLVKLPTDGDSPEHWPSQAADKWRRQVIGRRTCSCLHLPTGQLSLVQTVPVIYWDFNVTATRLSTLLFS